VSSHTPDEPDLNISPLTFLQVYQSTDTVMAALLEKDVNFRQWFLSPEGWRQFGRYVIVPLYYHLLTSGYGVMIQNQLVGWLYLRGWHQVLYVETLATHPDWRRQGVATALLRFAEQQAGILGREWMALTVTVPNPAVRLYDKEGYRRAHWRVMEHPGGLTVTEDQAGKVNLRPVFGPAAENAYHHFSEADQRAGDAWAADAIARLSNYDPYRQLGREYVAEVDGQAVGYLNLHLAGNRQVIYLAAPPERWGSQAVLKAGIRAIQASERHCEICFRLASSGHHDAARQLLIDMGFAEQPATTTRMFKRLPRG
jgi:GNAT superfamily N-acetyltransferase